MNGHVRRAAECARGTWKSLKSRIYRMLEIPFDRGGGRRAGAESRDPEGRGSMIIVMMMFDWHFWKTSTRSEPFWGDLLKHWLAVWGGGRNGV